MASAPAEPLPITGRVDRAGRLVAADAPLLRLQEDAGSALGKALALPQLAALARSALTLGVPLSRAVIAADSSADIDLWVRAEPQGDEVLLTIEQWTRHAPSPPRLAVVAVADEEALIAAAGEMSFDIDPQLRLASVSPAFAHRLGVSADEANGQPLTRFLTLTEDADGAMPLLAALGVRSDVEGQRATVRNEEGETLLLSATAAFDSSGGFTGFHGHALLEGPADEQSDALAFDHAIDEALRSPLDRIITAADRIVERSDGPLRSDYAAYAGDIAAAGRHLLSVIRALGDGAADSGDGPINVEAVVREAAALVEPAAAARRIEIAIDRPKGPLHARAEQRGIVQILVNILGNAIRHSPEGGAIAVEFEGVGQSVAITVADHGEGIALVDQQRIFDKYEQSGGAPGASGLGLAISRRLARAMGGDIAVQSAPGEGARFTLSLPLA